jgi:hypothetical protein
VASSFCSSLYVSSISHSLVFAAEPPLYKLPRKLLPGAHRFSLIPRRAFPAPRRSTPPSAPLSPHSRPFVPSSSYLTFSRCDCFASRKQYVGIVGLKNRPPTVPPLAPILYIVTTFTEINGAISRFIRAFLVTSFIFFLTSLRVFCNFRLGITHWISAVLRLQLFLSTQLITFAL